MNTRMPLPRIGSRLATIVVLAALTLSTAVAAANPTVIAPAAGNVALELVGQVINSSPTASIQFGYLPAIQGIDTAFGASPQDEKSALFTFYTEATTTRAITDGPFRVIDREGTTTIYYNGTPSGDFTNPDSFRGGMAMQVSTLHQQVIVDTTAQSFTVVNLNTITSSTDMMVGGNDVLLGAAGQKWRTTLTGRLTDKGPPSGFFAGFAVAVAQAT